MAFAADAALSVHCMCFSCASSSGDRRFLCNLRRVLDADERVGARVPRGVVAALVVGGRDRRWLQRAVRSMRAHEFDYAAAGRSHCVDAGLTRSCGRSARTAAGCWCSCGSSTTSTSTSTILRTCATTDYPLCAEHIFGLYAHIFLTTALPLSTKFAASVFETPLTSDDVFHGEAKHGVWHTRWMLIVGTFGSTMNMIRSYRAGDAALNLSPTALRCRNTHLPPYRPCRLRSPSTQAAALANSIYRHRNGVAAPHAFWTGLLLTSSFSYPVPADLTKQLQSTWM